MKTAELYDATPDGAGGVRLTPRRRIQTRDARTCDPRGLPLFRQDDAVRLPTPRERGQTLDDLLTGPTPEKRIGRGLIWDGSLTPPHHDEFIEAVEELGEGTFAAGRVLHAQDLEAAISLGRQWIGELETLRNAVADAELRAGKDQACDVPPNEKTKDARSRPIVGGRLLGGVRSAMFDATRTRDLAASLKKGREAQAVTAPMQVRTGADYDATLKAGRAAKA